MNRTDRKLFARTVTLGLLLALAIIAADAAGLLNPLERHLYDLRARLCQFFTPSPTDRIVHLDIDDPTLKELGAWPWPRTRLAEMIDEIHLAGAKVIGLDVIFPEPQETRYVKHADGTFEEIQDDQNLAAAVQRAGNVLIPVSVILNEKAGTRPLPGLGPMLTADSELATIAPLAEALRFTGVVEFLADLDGVARSVPLFVNHRGKLVPHMALAAVCAELDVPIDAIKADAHSITLPLPDGPPIVIPIRNASFKAYGTVGMFMDIPWFGAAGRDKWKTMFDWPQQQDSKQHVPLSNVWSISQNLHTLQKNNDETDAALRAANEIYPSPQTTAFLAHPDDAVRPQIVAAALKDMSEMADIPALERAKHGELKDDEAKYLAAYRALRDVAAANRNLADVIEKQRKQLREHVAGRYALIGWAATGKTDFWPTSLHPLCPGVAMQGVVFNAIVTRDFWKRSPWWIGAMLTFVLGAATTFLVARLPAYTALFYTLLLVVGFLAVNGILLFDYGNYIVTAAAPVTAAALICFGVTVARFIYERRERGRITRRFSAYADPALVNFVVENPDAARFDGQLKSMSVVFTDLAGFTTISEKLRERTVPLLNEYFSLMLPIIRENRGLWNKFLGDGIMFFFNAPADNDRHARDAVWTVLQMQKAMVPFNQQLLKRGLPQVAMRAGITTGMMVVGDAGSTDEKHHASDYTVLGDEVNLAARLESANKALGSRVLISRGTAEVVDGEFLLRPMGTFQVVGRSQGVVTYEALAVTSEATDQQKQLAELSARVVDNFRSANFAACIDAARAMEDALGSSKFTQLYLQLSREYQIQPPPPGFDGLIVLEEK